jgi:RimJ/RimL family protein N-acetyltransferase
MTPILETERLILRAQRLEDFPAHLALWSDPCTLRHFAGVTYGGEELWLRFLRTYGLWTLLGYGYWAIEEKATSQYVGTIGFFLAKRAIEGPWRDDPEAGWAISPRHTGQGFAREALAAAVQWSDTNLPANQSWCMIDPGNAISMRVARRAGYLKWGDAEYKGRSMHILVRPRGGQPGEVGQFDAESSRQ